MNQITVKGRLSSVQRVLVMSIVLLFAFTTACSRQEVPRSWVVGKWEGKAGATIIFDESGNVRVHKLPIEFDASYHVADTISGSGTWEFYGFDKEDGQPYPIDVNINKKDGSWGTPLDVAADEDVIYVPYDIDLMKGFDFKRVSKKK